MRALRNLLIVVIVLGGLFVAADRAAVAWTEDRAANEIQRARGLSGRPEVTVHGFPFLTQVAGRSLNHVDVRFDGLTARSAGRSLRIAGLSVVMREIQLDGNFRPTTARHANGSARVTYRALSEAAEDGVSVAYGGRDSSGGGKVTVTARLTVPLVGRVERSVRSTVSVVGGDTVRLRADAVPGTQVPGLENLIRGRIDFERKVEGLPDGMALKQVEADRSGLVIGVTGADVDIRR